MKLSRRRFIEALGATPIVGSVLAALPKASPAAPVVEPKLTTHFDPAWDDDWGSVSISASHSPEREDSDDDDY